MTKMGLYYSMNNEQRRDTNGAIEWLIMQLEVEALSDDEALAAERDYMDWIESTEQERQKMEEVRFEISLSRLAALINCANELDAYECAGVDNWSGRDEVEWPDDVRLDELKREFKEIV